MIKKRYQVNLPEQQAECEANYYRLRRLLGDLSALSIHEKRQYLAGNGPENDSIITLSVTEQTKYTTLVHIVQGPALQKNGPCDTNAPINKPPTHNLLQHHSCDQDNTDNNNCGQLTTGVPCAYEAIVRVYHDVDLAEIVSCQHHRQFSSRYEYPNEKMHQVDEKAQVNRFLSELLAHCLMHGRVNHHVISPQLVNRRYA